MPVVKAFSYAPVCFDVRLLKLRPVAGIVRYGGPYRGFVFEGGVGFQDDEVSHQLYASFRNWRSSAQFFGSAWKS